MTHTLPQNQFKCFVCKRTYEKGWSEDEALAELAQKHPDYTPDECEVVCDDCFQTYVAVQERLH